MTVLECEGPDPVLASWRCWHRLMEDRVTVAEGWRLVVQVTRRLDKFIATATLELIEPVASPARDPHQ